VLSFYFGIISAAQDFDNPCSANQCNACKNVYSIMIFWVLYTPALQMIVLLVGRPPVYFKPHHRNVAKGRVPPIAAHGSLGNVWRWRAGANVKPSEEVAVEVAEGAAKATTHADVILSRRGF
jgi:hypothetical protein